MVANTDLGICWGRCGPKRGLRCLHSPSLASPENAPDCIVEPEARASASVGSFASLAALREPSPLIDHPSPTNDDWTTHADIRNSEGSRKAAKTPRKAKKEERRGSSHRIRSDWRASWTGSAPKANARPRPLSARRRISPALLLPSTKQRNAFPKALKVDSRKAGNDSNEGGAVIAES